jgi:hypothetical protein
MQLLVLVKETLSNVIVPNFYFCKLFNVLAEYGRYLVAHILAN